MAAGESRKSSVHRAGTDSVRRTVASQPGPASSPAYGPDECRREITAKAPAPGREFDTILQAWGFSLVVHAAILVELWPLPRSLRATRSRKRSISTRHSRLFTAASLS